MKPSTFVCSLSWLVPLAAIGTAVALTWWSFTYAMQHRSGGGDGGLGLLGVVLLPVYGAAYALLRPAVGWALQRHPRMWHSIPAVVGGLLSLGTAALLLGGSPADLPALVLRNCSYGVLAAMPLMWRLVLRSYEGQKPAG